MASRTLIVQNAFTSHYAIVKSNRVILWETKLFYVVAVSLLLLGMAFFFTMRSPSVPDESVAPPEHAPTR